MVTTQQLFDKSKSGEISEVQFLTEVKKDPRFKHLIHVNNNYEDVVSILKNNSIISENTETDKAFNFAEALKKMNEIAEPRYNSEHEGYLLKKIAVSPREEWKIVDSYPTAEDAVIAARDKKDARLKGVSYEELSKYGISQPKSDVSWIKEELNESKKNKIKGGKGDKKTADDVNYYEFQKGWKHELEHTDDIDKAKEIAIDHLCEDPMYYTNLEMMEYLKDKKKRTDLPKEYKKGDDIDKENQMTPVKSITTSVGGKVTTKKLDANKKNVSDKKEKAKKIKTKVMKGGSGKETSKPLKENFEANEAVSGAGKIEKYVKAVNMLIKNAIDSDGDPIEVIDPSGTWEQPYKVLPIEIKGNKVIITSSEFNHGKEKVDKTEHNISKPQGMDDAMADLRLISKLYKKAYKKNNISLPSTGNVDEMMSVNGKGKLIVNSNFDRAEAKKFLENPETNAYHYEMEGHPYTLIKTEKSIPALHKKGVYYVVADSKDIIVSHKENNVDSFLDLIEKQINIDAQYADETDRDNNNQRGDKRVSGKDFPDPNLNEAKPKNPAQLKLIKDDNVDVKKVIDIWKKSKGGEDTTAEEEELNPTETTRLKWLRSGKVDEKFASIDNDQIQAILDKIKDNPKYKKIYNKLLAMQIDARGYDLADVDKEVATVQEAEGKEKTKYEVSFINKGKVSKQIIELTPEDYEDMMKTVDANKTKIETNKKNGDRRLPISGPFDIKIAPGEKKATVRTSNVKKEKYWWKRDSDNAWSSGDLSPTELKKLKATNKKADEKGEFELKTDAEYQAMVQKADKAVPKKPAPVGSKVNFAKFQKQKPAPGKSTPTKDVTFSDKALDQTLQNKSADAERIKAIAKAEKEKRDKEKKASGSSVKKVDSRGVKQVSVKPTPTPTKDYVAAKKADAEKSFEPKADPANPAGSLKKDIPNESEIKRDKFYLTSYFEKNFFDKPFDDKEQAEKVAKEMERKNPEMVKQVYKPAKGFVLLTLMKQGFKSSANEGEEKIREIVRAMLKKKLSEYNTFQAQEGPAVKMKELERMLQGLQQAEPENAYQQVNKQQAVEKIRTLVDQIGPEAVKLVKEYLPNGTKSLREDHLDTKQDQVDYIVASGHYKGKKDDLLAMDDAKVEKIYLTVEKIEKQRKISPKTGVDLGKSFDKFKKAK